MRGGAAQTGKNPPPRRPNGPKNPPNAPNVPKNAPTAPQALRNVADGLGPVTEGRGKGLVDSTT